VIKKNLHALVLGGRGAIGNAIASRLQLDGCEVKVVGRREFNLDDSDQIDNFFKTNNNNYDILIHFKSDIKNSWCS